MFNISEIAGNKIIHSYHLESFPDKPVAQMRTQEAGCACYQNLHINNNGVIRGSFKALSNLQNDYPLT